MAEIAVASPPLKILPGLQNDVFGAELGLRAQTETETISRSNTAAEAILGSAGLQLSPATTADPITMGLLGTLWTPRHLTLIE